MAHTTADCRRLEKRKYLQKRHQALWRVLKQKKRENPYSLPDMCAVVAEVALMEPPPPGLLPLLSGLSLHDATDLVRQSSEGIAEGVLQIYRMGFR